MLESEHLILPTRFFFPLMTRMRPHQREKKTTYGATDHYRAREGGFPHRTSSSAAWRPRSGREHGCEHAFFRSMEAAVLTRAGMRAGRRRADFPARWMTGIPFPRQPACNARRRARSTDAAEATRAWMRADCPRAYLPARWMTGPELPRQPACNASGQARRTDNWSYVAAA